MIVNYRSTEHMEACIALEKDMKKHGHYLDRWHMALAYCLTVTDNTRKHIRNLYDIREDLIKRKGLEAGWITGTDRRCICLGFLLYTDRVPEENASMYQLSNILDNEIAPYLLEAIRIRFRIPSFCPDPELENDTRPLPEEE